MFCSDCGSKANGKFCWNCGAALHQPATAACDPLPIEEFLEDPDTDRVVLLSDVEIRSADPDWSHEVRYEVLRKHLAVQKLIAHHAAMAPTRISGEKFLQICAPLTGGVALDKVATVSQSLYSSMGIATGQSRSASIPRPVGSALVALLCSMARQGLTLKQVDQASDGCVIQAELPSDLWSLAGSLVITVQRAGQETTIEATTRIGGQWMDWGKSRRCLDRLFSDVETLPVAA